MREATTAEYLPSDTTGSAPRRRGKEAAMVIPPQPCGTRDEGRHFGAGRQGQAPDHRSKA
jgi:hypothetical protein